MKRKVSFTMLLSFLLVLLLGVGYAFADNPSDLVTKNFPEITNDQALEALARVDTKLPDGVGVWAKQSDRDLPVYTHLQKVREKSERRSGRVIETDYVLTLFAYYDDSTSSENVVLSSTPKQDVAWDEMGGVRTILKAYFTTVSGGDGNKYTKVYKWEGNYNIYDSDYQVTKKDIYACVRAHKLSDGNLLVDSQTMTIPSQNTFHPFYTRWKDIYTREDGTDYQWGQTQIRVTNKQAPGWSDCFGAGINFGGWLLIGDPQWNG